MNEVEGRYSNHMEIGQNAFEFVLAFGQLYDESEQPLIHTRIVTSPYFARRFSELLQESIRHYEETVGPIPATESGLE